MPGSLPPRPAASPSRAGAPRLRSEAKQTARERRRETGDGKRAGADGRIKRTRRDIDIIGYSSRGFEAVPLPLPAAASASRNGSSTSTSPGPQQPLSGSPRPYATAYAGGAPESASYHASLSSLSSSSS
ncbi:hypothetical protein GSI_07518 [Ganoderma sinense ZZ0214-1]|uniref:Uncharacterized protein n=1 Tax=Ganoderma sinense ZZ0214-1 TaxID=1077348 RepID=A0A2G8S988_9APHY|nr:hypothetical protein GSI_07518 [Ganoderma sinense ZZ0214-1]